MIYKVLTIAGSDCSGGAGIQADIKTMAAHGVYAMSVITALTAQNTTGVYDVMAVDPDFVAQQIDCIFQDIRPDAVKIGMVSNTEVIEVISDKLLEYDAKNIVVDPVMVSTSGSRLISEEAVDALKTKLLTKADVITPNIPEAEVLCDFEIHSKGALLKAAEVINHQTGTAVLVKGGHFEDNADDLLFMNEDTLWFDSERVENQNTHGTGCTLSSAIAANLAKGLSLAQSVREAKEYITGALRQNFDLGKGSGPLNHMYRLNETRQDK